MTDSDCDGDGRYSDHAAARLLAGASFAPSERRWTTQEVESRLIEAARNHERFVARTGPSQKITHWIDWRLFRNISSFDRNAQAEGLREKTRMPDRRSDGAPSGQEISRILEAIEWPMRYLRGHDDERAIVSIWFWCETRNQPFSRWHKQACAHRSTAYRRLDRGFQLIANGLLTDGVRL
jgi:hypothetical protein